MMMMMMTMSAVAVVIVERMMMIKMTNGSDGNVKVYDLVYIFF
jgi:hypothetical protein